MKSFAKYKKAIAGMMAMTLIGLIIVAIAIATSWIGMDKIIGALINMITKDIPGPTNLATPANFDRLNEEIEYLLDDGQPHVYKVIPFTLGREYVLVGFNKDNVTEACTLKYDQYIVPEECKQESCLCIFKKAALEETCQAHLDPRQILSGEINRMLGKICNVSESTCIIYEDIEQKPVYFIGGQNAKWSQGDKIDGISDPITEEDANYLVLYGECGDKRWNAKNLYIEKAKKEGKVFIFMSVADEETEKRTKSCINYEDEYECAFGHDGSGHNCVPYYDKIGRYSKCDVCPTTCTLSDYVRDWLVVFDPCECAPEVEQEEMCLDYKEEYECALGSTEERGCVPEYKQGVFDMCVPCSLTCSLEEYPNDWLRGMDNCGCVNQMQPKAGCSLYDDEYECAAGKDFGDNKCLPKYDVLRRFSECINCPKDCKLDIYPNEWLKALDPCGCAESYAAE